MATRKPNPSMIDNENPEWTAEDFKKARPAAEVLREMLPKEAADEMLNRNRGVRPETEDASAGLSKRGS